MDTCGLSKGETALQNKWALKIKLDENGNINQFNASLVVKGFSPKRKIGYIEMFSSML